MNKDDLSRLASLCVIVEHLEMRSVPEQAQALVFKAERDRLIDKLTKERR